MPVLLGSKAWAMIQTVTGSQLHTANIGANTV